MKRPYLLMVSVLVLTIFSTLYDERTPEPKVAYRSISSVDMTKDGLCVENDSQWGKEPAPLTKESICKCHPDQCSKDEYIDTQKDKSYPIDIISDN